MDEAVSMKNGIQKRKTKKTQNPACKNDDVMLP